MGERIAVVGSGVIGLSVAHELAVAGHAVTVLSDLEPLSTTSAVAGAIWFPYAAEQSAAVDTMLDRSLQRFRAIARDPDAGVDERTGIVIDRLADPDRSWTRWAPARAVDAADLPPGATGMRTAVPLATMSQYLPWLQEQCHALGVHFEHRRVDDVDALGRDFDSAVVAAGAAGGALLGDDDTVVPIRGRVVRVANPGFWEFRIDDDGPDGLTYVLPRRDCVVLGGTHEVGETSLEPDPEADAAIIARCTALVPQLAGQPVVSRAAGVRPARARLRIEDVSGRALRVIAAYGHGGSGMTLSWGTAERVAALLADRSAAPGALPGRG